VNEHHQTAYGMMPSPIVTASALARRTKKAKIAILGSALPLRSHPMMVAEEHAMIDVISGGRLISGFVRGIGAEYHTFGVNPTFSHDRFHEAHDLIVRAWTEKGPVLLRRPSLQGFVRQPVAAAAAEAAPADLDSLAGLEGNDRLGLAPGPPLHLPADLQPGEGGLALPQDVPRHLQGLRL
jgi:alkanesulfonate monooxygenase SsuD/methylene tetrahydromethanopterin reductase-like flavin-dependent oxidoreductase (luciferase family)